jgi:hypothetical protein
MQMLQGSIDPSAIVHMQHLPIFDVEAGMMTHGRGHGARGD